MAHLAGEVEHDVGRHCRVTDVGALDIAESASTTRIAGSASRVAVGHEVAAIRAVARDAAQSITVTSAPPRRSARARLDPMKPSPPVTRHRRPATASTGHGVQSAASVRDDQASRPGRGESPAETRTSPSAMSHAASSAPSSSTGTSLTSVDRRRRARRAPRNSISRPTDDEAGQPAPTSSSSTASKYRALFTWSSTSKSLSRSGHGRARGTGSGRRWRRRPLHPAAPRRAP